MRALVFHLLQPPGKRTNISSSDRFPLKPTRENTKNILKQMEVVKPNGSTIRVPHLQGGACAQLLQHSERRVGRQSQRKDHRGLFPTPAAKKNEFLALDVLESCFFCFSFRSGYKELTPASVNAKVIII